VAVCAWTAGLLAVAARPVPSAWAFDGLPWTSLPELALLVVTVAVLGNAAAQERLRAIWCGRSIPFAVRGAAIVLPLVAFALGEVARSEAPPSGFAACYGTLVPNVPAPPCERSFDAPFAPASVTRYDRALDFAGNWRLGFVNHRRFNFYRPGQPDRQRLPFRATWSGLVQVEEGEHLEIAYVGEGAVQVGRAAAVLDEQYEGRTVSLAPASGQHRFVASYRFDDGSRVSERAPGRGAAFRIEAVRADGSRRPLTASQSGSPALTVLVAAFEGSLLVAIAVLATGLARHVVALLALALGVVWLAFSVGIALGALTTLGALCLTALVVAIWPVAGRPGVFLPVAMAVAGVCAAERVGSFTAMLVRSGGDDWLTYESFARIIFETRSLQGGEAVFYFQPFYRYAKFLLRLLFGEGEALVLTALNTAMFGGILMLTAVLGRRLPFAARPVAVAAAAGMFAMVASSWAQSVTLRGLSEPLAWALYPIAVALLFGGGGLLRQAAGMAAAGACAITRLNHAPAIALTAGTFFAHRRKWPAALPALALIAVLLLPLAHNLAYGGAFVVTTNSADIRSNLVISPRRLIENPVAPDVLRALGRQIRLMFNTEAGWWSGAPLLMGLRLAELLWLVAIGAALWRRTIYHALVAALPAGYLAVHLFYQVHVYYPRHIIAAHLAMAVSACLAFLPRPDPSGSG
jgi:hypothetical protein